MQCKGSVSESLSEFVYSQPYFVQTAIMLGFIFGVFLLVFSLWFSSIFGKGFQKKVSDGIQDWAGALCVTAIISILCSAAIEMNYWTGGIIPSCGLDGFTSIIKSVSMIVIFTLQIIFVFTMINGVLKVRKKALKDRKRGFDVKGHTYRTLPTNWFGYLNRSVAWHTFTKLERKIPLYRNSFPKFFTDIDDAVARSEQEALETGGVQGSVNNNSKGYFFTYGLPMLIGCMYSFLTASFHWLKFLTNNLGITNLKLTINLFGIDLEYSFLFEKINSLRKFWLGFEFVTPVIDVTVSILITGWFMWRFRLFPKFRLLRKLFSNHSKGDV